MPTGGRKIAGFTGAGMYVSNAAFQSGDDVMYKGVGVDMKRQIKPHSFGLPGTTRNHRRRGSIKKFETFATNQAKTATVSATKNLTKTK